VSNIYQVFNDINSGSNLDWSCPDHKRDEYLHNIFQYPAMMVPATQALLIKTFLQIDNNITNIFDPFMGGGSVLVSGVQNGLNCFGQDINPLSVLICKAKTGPIYYKALVEKFYKCLLTADWDRSSELESDFPNLNKWFKKEVSVELSKLKRAIKRESSLWARRIFWVFLAETVRLTSNDRTSTYKLHARPVDQIAIRNLSPIEVFFRIGRTGIFSYKKHLDSLIEKDLIRRGKYKNNVCVKLGNTKDKILIDEIFDLIVTSPPYGDNTSTITYGQHSFLPLQWIELDDIDSSICHDYLKTTHEIDSVSLGGRCQKKYFLCYDYISSKSNALKGYVQALINKKDNKFKKFISFYFDLYVAFENSTKCLKPGGMLALTIGDRSVGGLKISNETILSEFFESLNIEKIVKFDRTILSKRMPLRNATSTLMNKEHIIVFKKNI